ncbi:MAG: helix-turn-helix domain-containing protein [Thermoanaerobaculia bacterium]
MRESSIRIAVLSYLGECEFAEAPLPQAKEVAAVLGISRQTLYIWFRRELGVLPRDFLRGWRLLRGRALMSHLPVEVAARRSGFSSAASFRRGYRSVFGRTPRKR